ncbi:MAG: NfeD family protein [Nitriliruptorales bacterium]|nr:NfeD family protein [Nitriliruptorales bacterium]
MPHLTRAVARPVGITLGALALLLLLAFPGRADQPGIRAADDSSALVEILPLEGFLDPPTAGAIIDLVTSSSSSDLVVIQLDAPGVVSVDLDEIFSAFRASPVPVVVFVGPQGAAAVLKGGAVGVLAAAHVAAVAGDTTIGPIHPVRLDGGTVEDAQVLLTKAVGTPPSARDHAAFETLLENAMAAADLDGVVDLVVPGLEALMQELDGTSVETANGSVTLRLRSDEVEVRFHSLGVVRRLLHAASTGPFIYLLLTVGLGMLLFELFQPGFGVAGVAGIVTAGIGIFGLTVLPVTWWGVALVVLGLVLFAVDTAIAGFGPVTSGAVVALSVGSANFYDADALALPWWLIAGTVVTAFVFFVFVMTSLLRAQAGPAEEAVAELIGRRGVVRSVLNPEGHVFADGALWRARWSDEAHAAPVGTVVKVVAVDGPLVLVDAVDAAPTDTGEPTDEEGASGSLAASEDAEGASSS